MGEDLDRAAGRLIAVAHRLALTRDFVGELGARLDRPGLTRSCVYRWETGATRVPAGALLAAAAIAGCSLDELLALARDPKRLRAFSGRSGPRPAARAPEPGPVPAGR